MSKNNGGFAYLLHFARIRILISIFSMQVVAGEVLSVKSRVIFAQVRISHSSYYLRVDGSHE
jgi:hypothetical protein